MQKTPPGILPLIVIDRECGRPLNRQIYEGYRDAIVERRLRPGQRIPPTRSLAKELRVSRLPVLNAFEQLLAEGYFESRPGSGTFVASSVPDDLAPARPGAAARPRPPRSGPRLVGRNAATLREEIGPWFKGVGAFSVGSPPVDQFPMDLWSRLVARRSRSRDPELVHYSPVMGFGPLREAVAEYLRTSRGVHCEASQVMIVGGAQQALELSARVLLDAGSPVWVEDPGCYGVHNLLRLTGARTVPVPVDEEGLVVSEGIARSPRARAAFVTPSHQFPLGVTMSASRRLQLLDWAQSTGAWIIEDDYDSEYRYGQLPITSLQGLDRDARVIYVGTFSKIMFPALRVGYLVLPTDLVGTFVAVRRATDKFSPTLAQAALTDFIEEGHFARHVRRTRVVCGTRRAAMVEALRAELGPGVPILGDPAGMYLTMALSGRQRDREIALRAARQRLWVAPLSERYLSRAPRQGLLLGYGGTDAAEIAEGVGRLREVLSPARPKAIQPRAIPERLQASRTRASSSGASSSVH
ncbi:MAG TPA: PLP-dependent aminotransferase family protein [Thermoanaerobaculia bacterium]|jgi:GntR family transcriptional regulator/MocR family aminotransferase